MEWHAAMKATGINHGLPIVHGLENRIGAERPFCLLLPWCWRPGEWFLPNPIPSAVSTDLEQEISTVNHMTSTSAVALCIALVSFGASSADAADPPSFKSHLFENGTLVYSDDFDEKLDRKRWQPRTKTWDVADGKLIGRPDFKNAEQAEKALGRDHHLGLGPVIRLNKLPAKFVLHMRFKFEGEAFAPARPKFDIGHHINSLFFTDGGYSLKLSGGKRIKDTESGFKLNEWTEAVIEFQRGELCVEVNGHRKHIKDRQVALKSRDEITFKALEHPKSRLLFDYVRLWKVD